MRTFSLGNVRANHPRLRTEIAKCPKSIFRGTSEGSKNYIGSGLQMKYNIRNLVRDPFGYTFHRHHIWSACMGRTISVKEVAQALGLTERAVTYRLEKGQLNGTQTPNAFGKPQWRVFPTKEILDGLKKLQPQDGATENKQPGSQDINFSPDNQSVDVEEAVYAEVEDSDTKQAQADWQAVAQETLKSLAEELVRPLGETIKQQQQQLVEQQQLLIEKDRLIEDKERQLKLLPDLEMQAERERKNAEIKELETRALKKQIAALEEQVEVSVSAETAKQLEEEKAAKEAELAILRSELEEERKLKADELLSLKEQLTAISQKLETTERSWWKKFFGIQ
ncbi:MAG: hypothetical protein K2Y39_14375 [Candidatus Obscuribacterales bacterium]|nr:hypothetical protein [Candidatus Obscuribacterales bacterium]